MIAENQRLIRKREESDQLTCIVCPIGCTLTVTKKDDTLEVTGNRCKRGVAYAEEECIDPRRTVTGTCAIEHGEIYRVPVRSSQTVPVEDIPRFLNAMYDLRIEAPVSGGEIVACDLGGTGIDLMATIGIGRAS